METLEEFMDLLCNNPELALEIFWCGNVPEPIRLDISKVDPDFYARIEVRKEI